MTAATSEAITILFLAPPLPILKYFPDDIALIMFPKLPGGFVPASKGNLKIVTITPFLVPQSVIALSAMILLFPYGSMAFNAQSSLISSPLSSP
ncbi:hypothetical protein D3C87_1492690 [compost metagenome]